MLFNQLEVLYICDKINEYIYNKLNYLSLFRNIETQHLQSANFIYEI